MVAVFSEKTDGSMGSFRLGASQKELTNRENFLRKNGISLEKFVRAGMVQSGEAVIVSLKDAGEKIEEVDGLATREKNLFLAVTGADCLPIFIFDPQKEIVGLAHAGWRGLSRGVIGATVEKMTELDAEPQNILVVVGPGIGVCHYWIKEEVKVEMAEKFGPYFEQATQDREGKKYIDLKKIARMQLVDSGVREENIEVSQECTACLSDKYFSHRRDQVEPIETMMAVMGMRKQIL